MVVLMDVNAPAVHNSKDFRALAVMNWRAGQL
jgi:hypothetical protein